MIDISNIRCMIHRLVRNSINAVSEMEDTCDKLIQIVKRAADNSCCICCDKCLACDAKQVLNDLGEK